MTTPALAGDCDGTNGDDSIVCGDDSNNANLRRGDDDFTQVEGGVIAGDISGDGKSILGGDGGNDTIAVNGQVGGNVLGDDLHGLVGGEGGNDVITIGESGEVVGDVRGDDVTGLVIAVGGDDVIIVDGTVGGNVYGDYLGAAVAVGGDDEIIVNGTVEGNVVGDGILSLGGVGGNDTITINGTVEGDVLADGLLSVLDLGGDDEVIVGEEGRVGGIIDGGGGINTLTLLRIYQDILDTLDPSNGTISDGDVTYTWINFQFLLGKVREIVEKVTGPIGGDDEDDDEDDPDPPPPPASQVLIPVTGDETLFLDPAFDLVTTLAEFTEDQFPLVLGEDGYNLVCVLESVTYLDPANYIAFEEYSITTIGQCSYLLDGLKQTITLALAMISSEDDAILGLPDVLPGAVINANFGSEDHLELLDDEDMAEQFATFAESGNPFDLDNFLVPFFLEEVDTDGS